MDFGSLFVKKSKPEPSQKKEESVQQKPVVTNFTGVGMNSIPANPAVPQSGTNYHELLEKALQDGAKPEVDFLKFLTNLSKMDGQPIAEPQKYQNVFMMLETVGLTYDKLIDSGNYYFNILNKEKDDFDKGIASGKKTMVDDKNKEVERLTAEIKEKQTKLEQLSKEAFEANTHLLSEEQAFNNALNIKTSIFNDRIQKIQQYLGHANTTK